MKFLKIAVIIVSLSYITIMSGTHIYGQNRDHTVRMVLIDSIRQTPLEFATAYVIPEGEDLPLKYALSDEKGRIAILKVPTGKYTLKVEFLGYNPIERKISVEEGVKELDLSKILMAEQVNVLGTVVVTAIANPIIVKKDTIEYNASSFKTTESDQLEDLLKKLPGIEVDSEGKITANGKEISKIMIGGKTFFLNDPKLATKNLPAQIIEKVKVLEKKSDQAEFTGIDDGESETVIDLSVKQGMFDGWFGNLSGGYGTKDRYQGAGMVARFTDNSQLSLIGNLNNTNNRGFSDFSGSMMRSSGLRMGSFMSGNGITTSWMGGVNGNIESNNKKMRFAGSYLYSGSNNVLSTISERQNFLKDSSFNYSQNTTSGNNTEGHRVNFEIEYKFSKQTSLLFRPNLDFGYGTFGDEKVYNTAGALAGVKINDGKSIAEGENRYLNTDGHILFRHRFSKPGRTISLNFNYSFSNNGSNSKNRAETNIYDNGIPASTNIMDQYKKNLSDNYSLGTRISYTEPLGWDYVLELSYMYRFRENNSERRSYNFNNITGEYDILDEKYSNNFLNRFVNQDIGINLNRKREKYNITIGFSAQPSSMTSTGSREIYRPVVNYSPSARLNYNISDSRSINLRYRGRTNQPSINQLQPVADNTNPLYIPLGNPELLPEFTHSLMISFSNTNKSSFRTTNMWMNIDYTLDKIVNKSWYTNEGVQHSMPVNEQGVYSISTGLLFNSPIAKTGITVMSHTMGFYNRGVGFVGRDEANIQKNHTRSLSITELLHLTYRNEYIELTLGGNVNYSNVWYTIQTKTRRALWNNAISAGVNWTLPIGLNIKSNVNRRFYYGYDDNYNKAATIWNAEVAKNFLNGQMTLSVRAYDILNQSNNIRRISTDNYIEDLSNNTLSQYIMFSLTYRFGTFSKPSGDYNRQPYGGGYNRGGGFGGYR